MRVISPIALILFFALIQLLVQLNAVTLPLPPESGVYFSAVILALGVWLLFDTLRVNRQSQLELQKKNQMLEQVNGENHEVKKALQEANRRAEKVATEAQETSKGTQEVLNFLGILQTKGRLIDFLMDDVARYPDAQVGAAARIVHQGCASVIREYFDITPVYDQQEGSSVTLEKDYDAKGFRLLGKVMGEPPFKGRLLHHGWRTTAIRLPKPIHAAKEHVSSGVIAPAEVEIH